MLHDNWKDIEIWMEIRCWILNYLSDSFPHIRQVSFRSNSHVINLPVFNRRRFALIMLFPMCTNDKNLYSCLSVDEWVCTNACVCVWQNVHKFYFYSPEGCCKIFYNTTNVTFVIQHPTKVKTKNDWLLKNGKNSKN